MKKVYILLSAIALFLSFNSCDKDSLKLENPNEPGLEALATETGMQKSALGIYYPMSADDYSNYYIWFAFTDHNAMGDATTVSAGNFGWRYANQPTEIILSNGTVVPKPEGGTQIEELARLNSRDQGSDNIQNHEWTPLYGVISHANLILSLIDETPFEGSADQVEVKKNTYKAWYHWWKGFAYSRIGSIYAKGLIVNKSGEVNTNYVSNTEILEEAKRNLEQAKSFLANIAEDDNAYASIITASIPSPFQSGKGGLITPGMFIRNINTLLARNILVNKYAKDLTAQDLSEIKTYASNGIKASDKIFNIRSASVNCFVEETAWSPYRLLAGWENLSERLVQDFKTGDQRYTRNVKKLNTPVYNPRGRGIGYGTRYTLIDIAQGGDYASLQPGLAELPFATTYEENQLMLAEVEIRSGNINPGLVYVDEVRKYQNAGLAATANTGLNQAQALEELRRERRVGLFLKNTSFYDARRWGVLKPISDGGGRKNVVVVTAADGTVDTDATINYNYKEWWDVPANETDFNPIN